MSFIIRPRNNIDDGDDDDIREQSETVLIRNKTIIQWIEV